MNIRYVIFCLMIIGVKSYAMEQQQTSLKDIFQKIESERVDKYAEEKASDIPVTCMIDGEEVPVNDNNLEQSIRQRRRAKLLAKFRVAKSYIF